MTITMVQELGFQAMLNDKDIQDEGLTHTSMPWKNLDLELSLP